MKQSAQEKADKAAHRLSRVVVNVLEDDVHDIFISVYPELGSAAREYEEAHKRVQAEARH